MSSETKQEKEKSNIFVNGMKKEWNNDTITFSQVVDLAYSPPHRESEIFTVQYSKGLKEDRDGTLVAGQGVKVKSGMVFDVTRTDKS